MVTSPTYSDLRQVASVLAIPLVAIVDKIPVKVELAILHLEQTRHYWDEHGSKGLVWRKRQNAVADFWDCICGGFSGHCMDTSCPASSQSRKNNLQVLPIRQYFSLHVPSVHIDVRSVECAGSVSGYDITCPRLVLSYDLTCDFSFGNIKLHIVLGHYISIGV
jgi:hypothetical protein